jgi:cytochrome c oxidase subunit 2
MPSSFGDFINGLKTAFMYGTPKSISTHGASVDHLIDVLHYFMIVLFVGWGIYLVYCMIRFRDRQGHTADTSAKHFMLPKYVEIGVVLFEAFLLIFLSGPIWARVKTELPKQENAMEIRITAEQFAWNVHYPGRDGKFGTRKVDLIDGTNPIGVDRNDPNGKDDIITINQLNIPVNKPIKVILTSKDVIHSFFLPNMRIKQDAIPGMEFEMGFTATETGEFQIQCAQLCGIGHYRMGAMFNVMTDEQFNAWKAEEEKSLGLDEEKK